MSDASTKTAIQNTATTGLGTAAGGSFIIWLFQCAHAHQFLIPSDELALMMAGALAPFAHVISRAVMHKLAKIEPEGESDAEVSAAPLTAGQP